MKRTLSLFALVLSMSFPGGSAFALTLQEKGAELDNPLTEAYQMGDAQNFHNKFVTERSVEVKSDTTDALISKDGDRYEGDDHKDGRHEDDEYDNVDNEGKGSR